jgi:hypothetical protein
MKNLRVTCAAVLACASFAAMAQTGDAAASTHWRFGLQLGTVQDHDNTEPAAQVSMGYDFNRNVSVEALADISLLFMRVGGLKQGDREFDSAVGARVLGSLPLGDQWMLTGGLGVVAFQDEIGDATGNNVSHHRTSPMVSLAAMYRMSRRWSLGAEVSSFTAEHTANAGLRAEFHF